MIFLFYKRKTQILLFLPSVNLDVAEIGSIVERGVSDFEFGEYSEREHFE